MFSEAPVSDLLRIKCDPLTKLNQRCTVLSTPSSYTLSVATVKPCGIYDSQCLVGGRSEIMATKCLGKKLYECLKYDLSYIA